eukprot:scaffold19852_cov84-Isochrysis_galbana.AAC.1
MIPPELFGNAQLMVVRCGSGNGGWGGVGCGVEGRRGGAKYVDTGGGATECPPAATTSLHSRRAAEYARAASAMAAPPQQAVNPLEPLLAKYRSIQQDLGKLQSSASQATTQICENELVRRPPHRTLAGGARAMVGVLGAGR